MAPPKGLLLKLIAYQVEVHLFKPFFYDKEPFLMDGGNCNEKMLRKYFLGKYYTHCSRVDLEAVAFNW